MAPFRRDGQPDLGPTPLEFAQAQAGTGGRRKRPMEAPAPDGAYGLTPMQFAAQQAAGAAPVVVIDPDSSGDQGGGGSGPTPLAKPIES